MFRVLLFAFAWILPQLTSVCAFAENDALSETLSGRHVQISWLAPKEFSVEQTLIGLVFQTDPGWHVYWKNPGDSGTAPKFHFASRSVEVGSIQWPFPRRIQYGPLINFGYEGETGFLFQLTPKTSGPIELTAKLEWLVCQEECIPGRGSLALKRERTSNGESTWSSADRLRLAQFETRIPKPGQQAKFKIQSASFDAKSVRLKIANNGAKLPEFFPADGKFLAATPPKSETADGKTDLIFARANAQNVPATLDFVAVADDKASWEWASVSLLAPQSIAVGEMLALFLSAILGGVILNLMPCVLPVLSIKILSLAKTNHTATERVRESLLYSLGVVVTFTALGAVLLLIRSAGVAVGWGFHLQSPIVVMLLMALFWLMAMNFLGVFEMGTTLMNWAGRHGDSSSFATGVLSVAVAAPCTGPFMGSALGAAAVLPALQGLSLFFGLGLGLAAPVLLLAINPGLLKKLPRPGAWMEKLRQFFAFPLFATVVWLLWVLGAQIGTTGWLAGSILLLFISFSLWLGKSAKRGVRVAAWVIALVAIALVLSQLNGTARAENSSATWARFSEASVTAARNEKRPVFVDFTAAWCITCQVNRRAVLESTDVLELFRRHNSLLLEADWTKQDADITNALAAFGRNSVPLYIFYPADGSQAKVLPQILTVQTIQDLFPKEEVAK